VVVNLGKYPNIDNSSLLDKPKKLGLTCHQTVAITEVIDK